MARSAWIPSQERIQSAAVTRLALRCGLRSYDDLRRLALDDMEQYWRAVIDDLGIHFEQPFSKVLDLGRGVAWPCWFRDGRLNFTDTIFRNPGTSDDIALICASEVRPTVRYTRRQLCDEVDRAARRLHGLGVRPGDRVGLLLPNVAEAVFVVLACARIGSIVVPLYSAFGPEPIISRLVASRASLLVTTDHFIRNGKHVDLMPIVKAVRTQCPDLKTVAVIAGPCPDGRAVLPSTYKSWSSVDDGEGPGITASDPNDPWMVIFTSGTTGRPKGTVHSHAGFPLRVAHDVAYHFDFAAGDRFFWYSDMGWMIGPMAICAPLMLKGSLVLYDGGPTTPDALALLRVARANGVTHYGTSPTMLRAMAASFPRLPDDLRTAPPFKTLMTAGEVIDPETFGWFADEIGQGQSPVINYTGGTEVSGGILSNVVVRPIMPGVFNSTVIDVDADVCADDNEFVANQIGELVLRRPMLGMTHGFLDDPERYLESYWSKRPGLWSHGDLAIRYRDATGEDSWELRGRADDVLKISGRRVGPSEIEEAAIDTKLAIAAAAIGIPDSKAGQAVVLFVVPARIAEAASLPGDLRHLIGGRLGPGLRPAHVIPVSELPRTRNNKILRRVVRALLLGEALGDLSSLDNPASLDAVRNAIRSAGLTAGTTMPMA